jgi:putative ABC transport system substrate-binding protein
MRRREFITFLGGAVAWPFAAHAQQAERVWRIGMLFPFSANESQSKARLAALQRGLQELGWIEGRNLQIDARWYAGNPDDNRKNAAELVALAPEVIVASGSATVGPLLQATRTIPIVFTVVPDPVGAGSYLDERNPQFSFHRR